MESNRNCRMNMYILNRPDIVFHAMLTCSHSLVHVPWSYLLPRTAHRVSTLLCTSSLHLLFSATPLVNQPSFIARMPLCANPQPRHEEHTNGRKCSREPERRRIRLDRIVRIIARGCRTALYRVEDGSRNSVADGRA